MRAIIISGGKQPSFKLIKDVLQDDYIIVASDSGAEVTFKYNLKPDFIVGDLDSISKETYNYYLEENKCEFIKFSPEKDFTDTELAIEKALEIGADEIILLGCTGTRLDHLLANLGLLVDYYDKGVNITLLDDNNRVIVTRKPIVLKEQHGKLFSVQAFRENVYNLNIKNAKYELYNCNLKSGSPLTVSNEFVHKDVLIEFSKGILLIIFSRD